ncbi:MAG: segregation/condensation protein A [Mycoplasmatales bacterium]|nr:segregation/condensation protein A [Mycoplasmatales bacterium]
MNQTDLNINNFNGPLDLLLDLIKDKKLDIFDINLAELATEYVKLIDSLKNTNFDLAAEYLVMATTLIQLKAKLLLENPDDAEEIKKEKEDILKQLVEHQQFKMIANKLKEKEKERSNLFIKSSESYAPFELPYDESRLDGSSDAIKLIIQMRKMFERTHAKKLRETTIDNFNLSPAERRLEILEIIKKSSSKSLFNEIFNVPSMNHFVITMLTILDMSRKQELKIEQNNQFGEITIKKGIIHEW